jgi:hypothetical protein
MSKESRQHLAALPFEPFYILTSGGNRYRVAGAEHAALDPAGGRVVVWFDDGGSVTLSVLHIVGLEKETARAA